MKKCVILSRGFPAGLFACWLNFTFPTGRSPWLLACFRINNNHQWLQWWTHLDREIHTRKKCKPLWTFWLTGSLSLARQSVIIIMTMMMTILWSFFSFWSDSHAANITWRCRIKNFLSVCMCVCHNPVVVVCGSFTSRPIKPFTYPLLLTLMSVCSVVGRYAIQFCWRVDGRHSKKDGDDDDDDAVGYG